MKILVNGSVIIDQEINPEHANLERIHLIINGTIYVPTQMASLANRLMKEGTGQIEVYESSLPRIVNGKFELTNSFLHSLETPTQLKVNGKLSMSSDLDLDLFAKKISKLEVHGVIEIYQHQETAFYKKNA